MARAAPFRVQILPVVLLAMGSVFALMEPRFVSAENLTNVARQLSVLAILACGQLFAIVSGGIDLSPGSIIGLVSVVSTLMIVEHGIAPGIAAGVGMGGLLGVVNGAMVAGLRIPPMIATLGMLYFARGAAFALTGGMPVERVPQAFALLGKGSVGPLPVPAVIAGAVFLASHVVLARLRIGRYILAVGAGEESARLAGIPTRFCKAAAYVLAGFLAGLAGVVLSARMGSGQPAIGEGLEFESIAAAVLGGAKLGGGEGRVLGTVFGVLFLALLGNGLNLVRVSSFTQMLVIGAVLIVAIVADRLRQGWR